MMVDMVVAMAVAMGGSDGGGSDGGSNGGSDDGSDVGSHGWNRNSGGYLTNIRVHIRDYIPNTLVKELVIQSHISVSDCPV